MEREAQRQGDAGSRMVGDQAFVARRGPARAVPKSARLLPQEWAATLAPTVVALGALLLPDRLIESPRSGTIAIVAVLPASALSAGAYLLIDRRLRRLVRAHDGRLCPRCRYPLASPVAMDRCPECGTANNPPAVLAAWRKFLDRDPDSPRTAPAYKDRPVTKPPTAHCPPRCPACGSTPFELVHVHGHAQCASCGVNVEPCCQPQEASPIPDGATRREEGTPLPPRVP